MPRVRGPVPLLGSIKADLPYSAVASVETREEVYSTFGLVTEQRAYSVVTRDGVRLPLGTMVENWSAPLQLRFDQAAARIAERAGHRSSSAARCWSAVRCARSSAMRRRGAPRQ
jgi:hypothetical protein